MRFAMNGVGDLVPAVIPIAADPVLTPDQVSAMRMATAGGMGCTDCGGACMRSGIGGMGVPGAMLWPELANEAQQGRDVEYTVVGLAGMGDFMPANISTQPGIVGPFGGQGTGQTNGIVNALKQARGGGVGAVDTSSLSNFVTSVETGSSTLMGVTLPNWAWAGAALLGLSLMTGAHKKGR